MKSIPLSPEALERYRKVAKQVGDFLRKIEDAHKRAVNSKLRFKSQEISDGFGSTWDKKCLECGRMSMEVVRPGKVQCGYCG